MLYDIILYNIILYDSISYYVMLLTLYHITTNRPPPPVRPQGHALRVKWPCRGGERAIETLIGTFRGPLFRGPLIESLYGLVWPHLAKCLHISKAK